MVADTDKYIIGGIQTGFLMIPNRESFLQFCRTDALGNWYYDDKPFEMGDLVLLDFPAYFYYDTRPSNYWRFKSKESCLAEAKQRLDDVELKRQALIGFLKSVNEPTI